MALHVVLVDGLAFHICPCGCRQGTILTSRSPDLGLAISVSAGQASKLADDILVALRDLDRREQERRRRQGGG
jgi:hypothetical protein